MRVIGFLAIFFAIFLASVSQSAFAVDEETREEIVYRANLGRADDIKLLVSQGASPNQVDSKGTPLLDLAAQRTDAEGLNVLQALLDSGAKINGADAAGQNALFHAAQIGNAPAVKFLLDHHIDLQAIDANGDNVRVVTARAGHSDMVQLMDDWVVSENLKATKAAAKAKEDADKGREDADKAKRDADEKAAQEAAKVKDPATAPATKTNLKTAVYGKPGEVNEQIPSVDKKAKVADEAKIEQAIGYDPVAEEEALKEIAKERAKEAAAKATPSKPQPTAKELADEESQREAAFDSIIKHDIKSDKTAAIEKASEPATKTGDKPSAEVNTHLDEAPTLKAPEQPAPKPVPDFKTYFDEDKPVATQPAAKASELPVAKTPEGLAAEEKLQMQKDEAEEKKQEEVKHIAYEVAYHTCAFQYWAFCMEIRQSSELSSEEMEIAIESQKEAAESLGKKLSVAYKEPPSFYTDITNSAQVRIYDQLKDMPSNVARHEGGVGKMDDMESRCGQIARQWGFSPNIKPSPRPEDTGGKPNGKGVANNNKGAAAKPHKGGGDPTVAHGNKSTPPAHKKPSNTKNPNPMKKNPSNNGLNGNPNNNGLNGSSNNNNSGSSDDQNGNMLTP